MATTEELIIKIKAENSDLKSKLNDSEKSLDKFGKTGAMTGRLIGAAFGAVSVAAVVSFGSAAYKAAEEQEQANRRLLFAVKGNTTAFGELTAQAEKLRGATGIDDAAIMQIQQLGANSNKSTADIKKFTEAAVNLAAITGQDLQSAYMQLNQTLNGSAGRLTRVDKEFGALTEEQLKNGAAVDLVLEKYTGFAETSATVTQKLKSNWEEITESIGGGLATIVNPVLEETNRLIKGLNNANLTWVDKIGLLFNDPNSQAKLAILERISGLQKNIEGSSAFRDEVKKRREASPEYQRLKGLQSYMAPKGGGGVGSGGGKQTDALDDFIAAENKAYEKRKEMEDFYVQIPTFAQMYAEQLVPAMQSVGMVTDSNAGAMLKYKDTLTVTSDAIQKHVEALKSMEAAQMAGEVAGNMFMQATNENITSLDELGKMVYNTSRQIIASYLAEGIAASIKSALVSVPFPLNIVAAGVAGAGAGALFNTLVPKLADGGIAYGQTSAIVGEYAGARSNPEVIAPLDKLKDIIGGAGGRVEVYGMIRSGDIYLSNKRGAYKQRIRG